MKKGEVIRSIILDNIQKEFIGPYAKDESFPEHDRPKSRYWSGVLYPIQTAVAVDDYVLQKSVQKTDSDESDIDEIPINIGNKPSSLGITCHIPLEEEFILVYVSYG